MVCENREGVLTERRRDAFAAIETEDLHLVIVEERSVFEKDGRFLVYRRDESPFGRERRAKGRMDMCCTNHVRARTMYWVVNVVGGEVDWPIITNNLAGGAHQHRVLRARVAEVDAERQEPEVVSEDRVARGDVTVAKVAPPHLCEDVVTACQINTPPGALFLWILRNWFLENERLHPYPLSEVA